MNKELLEKGVDVKNTPEENNYQRYLELGGIINEKDYQDVLIRAQRTTTLDEARIRQAENLAKFAGIELYNTDGTIDQRIVLYGILRSDVMPEGVKYHHSQMSDQRILVEALRMLGDVESVNKMIRKYSNISFEYQRGNDK